MLRSSDSLTPPTEDGLEIDAVPIMDPEDEKEWVQRFKTALSSANNDQSAKLTTSWARNYRAYNNRHFAGSKYESFKYRNRSKLFKPKTRSAVRKNNAAAAQALFSTDEIVSVTPERAGDKLQSTTARFIHEVMNFRLDRANRWAGPNWFLTAMGAREDTQLTGICVSKQHWEYDEKTVMSEVDVETEEPEFDAMGQPVINPLTGVPMTRKAIVTEMQEVTQVIRDRPTITLVPPEHAFMDVTGDWRDPIQEGGFFFAAFPTRRDDIKTIIKRQADRNPMGGGRWKTDIDVEKLTRGTGSERQQAASVRRSRDEGLDRYESRMQGRDDDTIWLYECFYRIDGEDWHWWMLGESMLLSEPQPTEKSYPEQSGDRPYVRGLGAAEAHKTHPMSPVEAIQPMQMEINDITNLRLDAMKMGISPITLVRKGRGVDLKQVQNRGPDAHVLVENTDDVAFQRAPEPTQNSIMDVNIISNDLDDLAGVFSGASVQSNRQLNETVGGMKLLSQNANSLTEYDLRVWVETWVEPALRQFVNLIIYYENDATVIAVAGEKAGLIGNIADSPEMDPQQAAEQSQSAMKPPEPPITIDQVLGNLDRTQVQIRVNVGLGAMNTQERFQKLMSGIKATSEFAPVLKEQGITVNGIALVQEIWGMVGYKDGDRFFMKAPPPQEGPPPEVQMEMMRQKGQMEMKKVDAQVQGAKTKADNQTKLEAERMKAEIEMQRVQMEHQLRMQELAMQKEIELLKMAQQAQAAEKARQDAALSAAEAQGREEAPEPKDDGQNQVIALLAQLIAQNTTAQMAPTKIVRDANGMAQYGQKELPNAQVDSNV